MKQIKIDGSELTLHEKEIVSCNVMQVSVGTTGIRGGDSGWGGRTVLIIEDLGSSDLRCNVHGYEKDNSYPTMCEYEEADHIEIILGGDCELETFYTALKFAVEELGKYTKEIKNEQNQHNQDSTTKNMLSICEDKKSHIIEIFGKRLKIVEDESDTFDCKNCALVNYCYLFCADANNRRNRYFVEVDENGNEIK